MLNEHIKNLVTQVAVAFFSVGAVGLAYADPVYRHWSPVLGLCSQPFWFYMSYKNKLWGAFAVSILYTAVFTYGIVTLWSPQWWTLGAWMLLQLTPLRGL